MNKILREDLDYICDNFKDYHKFREKTFLITGATGLVGGFFTRALLSLEERYNLNIKIIAIVRSVQKARETFLESENADKVIRYIVADMNDLKLVEKVMEKCQENIDYVIHGASITASKEMVDTPVDTLNTAYNGTQSMLRLSMEKKSKMVYLSSLEMYGSLEKERVDETDMGYIDVSNVRSSYPESKRVCECLCNCYASQYEVDVCSARLAQTFGPGLPKTDNRVFVQFAKSVINRENIVMHTMGLSEKNYCYIRDAVEAIFILLIKGQKGEAYNIVNEACHTTIIDMAKMICHEFARDEIRVEFHIPESLSEYGYPPDIKLFLSSKKMESLGWKPTVDLKESYRRLIEYLK